AVHQSAELDPATTLDAGRVAGRLPDCGDRLLPAVADWPVAEQQCLLHRRRMLPPIGNESRPVTAQNAQPEGLPGTDRLGGPGQRVLVGFILGIFAALVLAFHIRLLILAARAELIKPDR